MDLAKPEYAQFAKDHVSREAGGASRLHLVASPKTIPHTLKHVIINRSISHQSSTKAAGRPHQPGLDALANLFSRHTRSVFGADVASKDEETGKGRESPVMVKTAPRSPFEMIQTQIIFGTFEVLLHLPAGTTQFQSASPAGRLMKMRQGIMVGFGFAGRPVYHQPRPFQFAAVLLQLMLQIFLAPSQAGVTRLAIRRAPRARSPLPGGKARGDLGQSASRGDSVCHIMPHPLLFRGYGMRPGLVPCTDLQEELHSQMAQPLRKFAAVPIDAIAQHLRGYHAVGPGLPDQFHTQLRLGPKWHLVGYARAPLPVLRPALGQIEPTPGVPPWVPINLRCPGISKPST